MKTIQSRDNPWFKTLKQWAQSGAARKKAGRTLLDGTHLCQSYLAQGGRPEQLILSERSQTHAEVLALCAQCQAAHISVLLLTDSLYAQLAQVEHGIDVSMIAPIPQPALPNRLEETAVVLDGVQDPGNLGSILRSAAAAGVRHVVCGTGTASAWSPKVLRAGMGGHFLLQIYEQIDLHAWLAETRLPVLATSSHTSTTLYQMDLRDPLIWLFGHEGQGVRPAIAVHASQEVTIPQMPNVESLNVAASVAVCLFEQRRQQLQSRV